MKKFKYKVGDNVEIVVDGDESGYHWLDKGMVGIITELDDDEDEELPIYRVKVEGKDPNWCSEEETKVIKTGKPAKVVPMKYILQYELDEDPFELFATLPEVKARIRVLAQNDSLKRDKIFVYEIKKTTKVEISTTTNIKGL